MWYKIIASLMIFLAGFLVAGNIICMKYDVINFNYEGSWFNIVLAMVVVGYAIPSIIKKVPDE